MIKKLSKIFLTLKRLMSLHRETEDIKMLQGNILINLQKNGASIESLSDAEFRIFSQFGDDGIIQYLIRKIGIPLPLRTFVEFGVEDYSESNTRFLLMNNNWKGLIIDGSERNMQKVKESTYFWRHDLTAVAAFIDKDNINRLIGKSGISGEIGLLSVDIDGNDYWVWENISAVNPWIVVAEYNSVFGSQHAITVPYDPAFYRTNAHYSNLYWGASLKALCMLANKKGYAFIGCNSSGNNAYFVRRDKINGLKEISVEQGFVASRFRESRAQDGKLTYLNGDKRINEILHMKVYNVENSKIETIKELQATDN